MTYTASVILSSKVRSREVAVFFLGQAGFVFKDSMSRLIAVDLYLSDCCERIFGLKRLIPKMLEPNELTFDIVIATHAHYDHFDLDSIPQLMSNSKTILYTSSEGVKESKKLPVDPMHVTAMSLGGKYRMDGIEIEAVYCDHGELAPDAVGILLKMEDKCIYITGDTAYRPEKILDISNHDMDLMIVPINGAFGNLNEEEAVLLTKMINPKTVVPCHYGNFAEHGGDPELFVTYLNKTIPAQEYQIMKPGGFFIL